MGQRGRPTVYTYEKVAALVPTCRNYYELSVALGMGWVSTERSQPQVKNLLVRLRKHGPKLDVSHFKKSSLGFVYPPVPRPVPAPKSPPRALLSLGSAYECAVCKLPPTWNGQDLRLQVDPINGLGWDDRAENLRFLCPNCHSQTLCNKNTRGLRELGHGARRGRGSLRATPPLSY